MANNTGIIVGAILVAGLASCQAVYQYGTQESVVATVEEKERIQYGESSKYLIFTDSETFENTDTIFYLKYSSSDFYRELDEGKTYRLDVYGWRIPFLSQYRNIVGYQEIK